MTLGPPNSPLRFPNLKLTGDAVFSEDKKYRYILSRTWNLRPEPTMVVVMLNPSTADAEEDDPTIRRVITFAKSWEFNSLIVLNLFAVRSPDPRMLKDCDDPVGPHNKDAFDLVCKTLIEDYGMLKEFEVVEFRPVTVLCAWGVHGNYMDQAETALDWLDGWRFDHDKGIRTVSLGLTNTGQPKHPLYLKGATPMEIYNP